MDRSFLIQSVSGKLLLLPCFVENILNANSVDPDQTSPPVASDLGLHCLLVYFFVGRKAKLG